MTHSNLSKAKNALIKDTIVQAYFMFALVVFATMTFSLIESLGEASLLLAIIIIVYCFITLPVLQHVLERLKNASTQDQADFLQSTTRKRNADLIQRHGSVAILVGTSDNDWKRGHEIALAIARELEEKYLIANTIPHQYESLKINFLNWLRASDQDKNNFDFELLSKDFALDKSNRQY